MCEAADFSKWQDELKSLNLNITTYGAGTGNQYFAP